MLGSREAREHRLGSFRRLVGLRACLVEPPQPRAKLGIQPRELSICGLFDALLDLLHAVEAPGEFALD
ncbi:MAG: hypothetical protein ACK559_11285, partial [bacterium]